MDVRVSDGEAPLAQRTSVDSTKNVDSLGDEDRPSLEDLLAQHGDALADIPLAHVRKEWTHTPRALAQVELKLVLHTLLVEAERFKLTPLQTITFALIFKFGHGLP